MVQVELTAFEAMETYTALLERVGRLNRSQPHQAHPLEASVVAAGLQASKAALGKVTDALYPEPVEPSWAPGELVESWGK